MTKRRAALGSAVERLAALALGLAMLAAGHGVAVSGQQGSGQVSPTPSPQPVFRATANFVTLDVVVTDKNDRPVTDLRQEEFRVTEKGIAQTVTDYSFVFIPASYRPIDLEGARMPAADVVANTRSANASRALAIVVDDTILPATAITSMKASLRGLLEGLAPDDQVAFTYVRRSDLGHDFTNDRDRLVESVNELQKAVGLSALGKYPTRDLYAVLENVIQTLSTARQSRKAIILIANRGCNPGSRVEADAGPLCQGVIDRALKAGVPIYALNPLGLMDAMSSAGAGGYDSPVRRDAPETGIEGATVEGRAEIEARISEENDSLKVLAQNTGGRAFVRSNLQSAVQELMSDNGNYYLLGYYPAPGHTDGKFHEVEVTVTRPGLRVRSRAGYMADAANSKASSPTRDMTGILGEGLPDPGLPIRAFVAPLFEGNDRTVSVVTIEVTYPVPDGGFRGSLDDEWRVGILALDAEGKIKGSQQRPVNLTGLWKPTARGTFIVNEAVSLPRNTANVRVGLTSRALGRTGTVHVPMSVPDFKKKDLQLSPLVIGGAAAWASQVDAVLGLDRIRGMVPFQPTLQRSFSAADSVRVFTRVSYGHGADSVAGDLRIVSGTPTTSPRDVRVVDLEGKLGWAPSPYGAVRTVDETLPLAGLEPGPYILRVSFHRGGKRPVVREVPFEIRVPGGATVASSALGKQATHILTSPQTK